MKLNAKQLRKSLPKKSEIKMIKKNPIYFVLDNICDTYNIGSLFRLADAVGVSKMYLCGQMEYPPSSRIHKASVGTENWVPWAKCKSTLDAIDELKNIGVQIIAVEQSPRSVHYSQLTSHIHFPCAIVVGHETEGVSKEILKKADIIVELPCAVIAYKILEGLP
jgi:23S rRNA (guanosine2251-2'-O)-methyltransferase